MYSFEYNGSRSKGIHFLRGLLIVSEYADNMNSEVVAHGDELGYMFDANDLFGNPIPEAQLIDSDDLKVRQNFIGMLVEFAKSFGKNSKKESTGETLFKSVVGQEVPFIKVDADISANSDFRFCELSVLGASLTPLTSTTCQGLSNLRSLLSPLQVGNWLDVGVGLVGNRGSNSQSNIGGPLIDTNRFFG